MTHQTPDFWEIARHHWCDPAVCDRMENALKSIQQATISWHGEGNGRISIRAEDWEAIRRAVRLGLNDEMSRPITAHTSTLR